MEIYDIDRERVAAAIKSGWQAIRVLQEEPTIDILRYAVSDDDDALVIEGDKTLIPGFSSLAVATFPLKRRRKSVDGLIEYSESDTVFIIYDIEALLTDKISYLSAEYEVLKTDYISHSGRCRIEASKIK
ncbi:hypothetical protein KAR91_75360 [Candidatus Pacearchaeota archaeon]|nr:hypothetical protein [Candidatus Pacearchaeota archaeon]